MTKTARAFDDVYDAEMALADALRALAERHAPDVDVYHVAHLLASRCAHQVELLVPHAERYEADAPRTDTEKQVSERASVLSSDNEAPGILLLIDLQRLYVLAHGAELAWVVLHQVAQAARDERLLHAATEGQRPSDAGNGSGQRSRKAVPKRWSRVEKGPHPTGLKLTAMRLCPAK